MHRGGTVSKLMRELTSPTLQTVRALLMRGAPQRWAVILLASALAARISMSFGAGWLRSILVLWFLFVCPGMAAVRLIEVHHPLERWTLAVAFSLALDSLVALGQLYTHHWSPVTGLDVLVIICALGVLLQARTVLSASFQAARARLAYFRLPVELKHNLPPFSLRRQSRARG